MEAFKEEVCPCCSGAFADGEETMVCPVCGAVHHQACWEANGGCANPECPSRNEEQPVAEGDDGHCAHCGAELQAGQTFCPQCGKPRNGAQRICSQCGTELQENHQFCPVCGKKYGEQTAAPRKPLNKKILIALGGAVAVIVLVIILALSLGGKQDFNKMYSDLADYAWCTIASDGSYLRLDTNPFDKDSDDMVWSDYENYYFPADDAIERINRELGFSDALMEKMNTTTWSQGRQTESNSKYTVTWTYHPDKGLEVMYEFKK